MSPQEQTLREQLKLHRLNRGWSFQQLATAIESTTGLRVSQQTLMRFIDNETEPHDTTTHAVRTYLEKAEAA